MIISVRVPPEKRTQINGWMERESEREREIERIGLHDCKVQNPEGRLSETLRQEVKLPFIGGIIFLPHGNLRPIIQFFQLFESDPVKLVRNISLFKVVVDVNPSIKSLHSST